jgi:hypothetical protein
MMQLIQVMINRFMFDRETNHNNTNYQNDSANISSRKAIAGIKTQRESESAKLTNPITDDDGLLP